VSPDDLATVERSWDELRTRQPELVERLEASFALVDPGDVAAPRAQWLVDAVADLVGLLSAPSALGSRARALAVTWPVPGTAPTFGVEGQAWMRAAGAVCPSWSDGTEQAWRRAWLLLADELADESLSPFASPPT
jgi:hypothetical protein